jgi:hypothetical protein
MEWVMGIGYLLAAVGAAYRSAIASCPAIATSSALLEPSSPRRRGSKDVVAGFRRSGEHPLGAELSPAASDFSLLVQRKVTKRKHLPRQIAQDMWVAKEFSDSASCLDPKTAAIHGRRPFGVSGFWWLLPDRESQKQRYPGSPGDLLPKGRLAFDLLRTTHAIRIRTPRGRPAWMPAVFGSSHGWLVRKWRRHRASPERFGFHEQVLSLVTFFAPAKKVTRLQAKALLPSL